MVSFWSQDHNWMSWWRFMLAVDAMDDLDLDRMNLLRALKRISRIRHVDLHLLLLRRGRFLARIRSGERSLLVT